MTLDILPERMKLRRQWSRTIKVVKEENISQNEGGSETSGVTV